MTSEQATADNERTRIVRELNELIAALDRRVPHVERVGEIAIARAAAALRDEALKRIATLEREAEADAAIPTDR
jgi:IS4 transposase